MSNQYSIQREYGSVFVGGALGSLLRDLAISSLPPFYWLTATFLTNFAACFVLGWLYAVRHRLHAHFTHLAAVGFCGGLSTFSSFAAEIAQLTATKAYFHAFSSSAIEISSGVLAALLGEMLGRRWRAGEAL